jgi:hypothetical protein
MSVKTLRGIARSRALVLVMLLLAAQLVGLAWPAYACGCGGMVPPGQSRIAVGQESSVVRWNGKTEDIVMQLNVSGDAEEAAWIMPVPNRAKVRLGDEKIFSDLVRITEPEVRERSYFWPRSDDWPLVETDGDAAGAAPGDGAGVRDVGRQRLGPFDVARLTATDPDALSDWLDDNGFALPPRLAKELKPYVEQKWEYVAVKLAPSERTKDRALDGPLDPLHLTFESDRLVYPMRLSRAARQAQYLRLYVLAPHRMQPRSDIGGDKPDLLFAGRLDKQEGVKHRLSELAGGGRTFLTAFDQSFPVPARINGDHELRPASSDSAFHKVEYDDELLRWGGVPVWLVTVTAAVTAVVTAMVLVGRRRRARPVVPPPSPWGP